MNGSDVEAIVRSVIVEHRLPFEVLDVAAAPSRWAIRLRHLGRNVVSVMVPDSRPVDVRVAIQERLEEL